MCDGVRTLCCSVQLKYEGASLQTFLSSENIRTISCAQPSVSFNRTFSSCYKSYPPCSLKLCSPTADSTSKARLSLSPLSSTNNCTCTTLFSAFFLGSPLPGDLRVLSHLQDQLPFSVLDPKGSCVASFCSVALSLHYIGACPHH